MKKMIFIMLFTILCFNSMAQAHHWSLGDFSGKQGRSHHDWAETNISDHHWSTLGHNW